MAQQHLLDLARIDVGAARDDHVLGAVAQREVAVPVERADIAGPQPALAQRGGGGLRVVPVAGHRAVAAAHHLAGLAGRDLPPRRIHHAHLDAGARDAAGREPREVGRAAVTLVVDLRQAGDGHRALALTEELPQARAEGVERAPQVAHVHRAAAVVERAQTGGARLRARRLHEPRDHRGRGEHRHVRMALESLEHVLRLEAGQHHLVATGEQMRQRVQARAVRQRRRMQLHVARRHMLDVGCVAQAHEHQVAVREHRALGPTGGAAGVEEPGEPGSRRLGTVGGRRVQQTGPAAAFGDQERGRRRAVLAQRQVDALDQRLAGEHRGRAAVAHDVRDLARMQLGVHRYRRQPADPATEQRLEELGAVLHAQHDPVSRGQPMAAAQAACDAGGTRGEFTVRPGPALCGERGAIGRAAGALQQAGCDVHAVRPLFRMMVDGRGGNASWRIEA